MEVASEAAAVNAVFTKVEQRSWRCASDFFVAVSKYLTKETGGEVCFGSQFESTEYHGGKAQTGA